MVGVQVAKAVLVVLQGHLEIDAIRRVGCTPNEHGPTSRGHVAIDVEFTFGIASWIDLIDAILAVPVAKVVAAVEISFKKTHEKMSELHSNPSRSILDSSVPSLYFS